MSGTRGFSGWAILELRGRGRVAGLVSEHLIAGLGFLRVEPPADGRQNGPRLYPASLVDSIRLASEEEVRAVGSVPRPLSLERIAEAVSDAFEITPRQLFEGVRDRRLALPRQVAMRLARELTSESLGSIARAFGARHHSSAHRGLERLEERLQADPRLRDQVVALRARLEQARVLGR